ncbi:MULTISPECIES: hypothetical protein [Nocardiaceae]|uniref:Uncharacterized protein n=1 Tax=Rhodococcoides corynebacterioides TaxID=53972 RepID=A0ABS2KQV0_9NOCA|nr:MULTISPECIES: hypothetical protein [Rhodococcus]MBM7413990.1 hypothetical protein [Rhodococcus corynebacterioides]MBP1116453.1 hypothetical protein [Rhodococcus sp. PvP016]
MFSPRSGHRTAAGGGRGENLLESDADSADEQSEDLPHAWSAGIETSIAAPAADRG